jgi:hypothetical protein
MAFEDLNQMMESYAEDAVKFGDEFQAKLDFSEESLREVEAILARLRDPAAGSRGAAKSLAPEPQEIETLCKVWGGYFGEVVRRRFGGDWELSEYPGFKAVVPALNINGSKIFPQMKVYRRLTEPGDENIWNFYEMIRKRLESNAAQVQ